jgi:DNA-binding NarL/FixJ family response regulator
MTTTNQADAPPTPLRVVIADHHGTIRRGLKILLNVEPDIDVVGEAATAREAIDMAQEVRPSVLLMDRSMPDLDGFAATREILSILPDLKVLIISNETEPNEVAAALASGAVGYLARSSFLLEAATAVRQLHRGHRFIRTTQPWLRLRSSQS